MDEQNQKLLEEIYQATAMGLEATELILPKVDDESLREEIERQGEDYKGMNAKTERMLSKVGREPVKKSPMQKAMLWGSVQMSTLMNSKPDHIAELMINGTTMGIIDMTKRLNDLKYADAGAKKLAEEFISNQQKSIENLKKHLHA